MRLRTLLKPILLGTLTFFCAFPNARAAGVQEVVVVFKTHFDIGYTDMASNVVQRYRTTMIDDALKVVDQNRSLPPEQQFAWTIPGWPATKILEDWTGRATGDGTAASSQPARQDRVREAFKQGRFVVHALPFSTHTELFEPEDLVRGLGYSTRITRDLALELPRDAKMTDVPCHSWILPTLLRHAGVDFLHLGCNAASSSPRVPLLFWWEGPDGSRLLTMYSAAGYGTGLTPPADWPYRTWLALIQTGDNHGPPRPEEVGSLLAEARQKLPGVKVRIGRLSDFADALLAEKADVPVVRGDMPDTWIHGPMCDPAGARLARNLRPMLGSAESLHTHLGAWGLSCADPTPTLAAAREQSLLYGEHTWGGAFSWVTSYGKDMNWHYGERWQTDRAAGRFKRLEGSWAEHSAYIEKGRVLAEPILKQELDLLARSVDVSGKRIVVFNPLPWKRDGLVRVHAPQTWREQAVKAADGGQILPAWRDGDSLCFVARDLPASGYRTYRLVEEKQRKALPVDATNRVLENPFFKLTLDPVRPVVASLVDKQTGRELVDTSAPVGFGQFLYERFDSNNVASYVKSYVKIDVDWALAELGKPAMPPASEVPYKASSPRKCEVRFERSAGAATAVLSSPPTDDLQYPVTLRLTLYAGLPCVDLEVTLHNKPADPWPEAGWLCLPLQCDAPQFRLGRLGGIVDPARDVIPGANHDLFAIHTGLALFDQRGAGVGLCPLDSPLVSLERPGCWKYSPEFIPRKGTVFVNLFNNQWTTNFRLWNSGTWTSRVRLWSFSKYDPASSLVEPSLAAREAPLAVVADGDPGPLKSTKRGVALSRAGVTVTAFGPNPDGAGTLLRLWEYAGQTGTCRVQLPDGLSARKAQPVDLRGRPNGEPIQIRGSSFTVPLRQFAPYSVQLTGGNEN
jgi:hypothetical protein